MDPVTRRLIGTTDPSHPRHSPFYSHSHVDLHEEVVLAWQGLLCIYSLLPNRICEQLMFVALYAMLQGWHRPALLIAVCAFGCVSGRNIRRIQQLVRAKRNICMDATPSSSAGKPPPFFIYTLWLRLGGGTDKATGLANKVYKNKPSPRYQVLIHHSLTTQFNHSSFTLLITLKLHLHHSFQTFLP
jgi:hypothetical protein